MSSPADASPNPSASVSWRMIVSRCAVLIPAIGLFGIAVGIISAGKGFSLAETAIMSAVVFAGASQVAAIEAWTTPPSLLAIAAIVAAVNSRFFLVGATLAPILRDRGPLRTGATLFVAVDPNWAMAMGLPGSDRHRGDFVLMSGLLLIALWFASTVIGYLLGAGVTDMKRLGMDLLVIVYFTGLVIPLWRGGLQMVAWLTAAGVATAIWAFYGGHGHIVAGALAGALVATVYHDDPVDHAHAD